MSGNDRPELRAFRELETLTRRAEYNLSHRVGDVRIFEIGSAFARGKSAMPREQMRLGVLLMGRRRPPHFSEPQPPVIDEWDAKAVAEVAASVVHRGQRIELVSALRRLLSDFVERDRAGDACAAQHDPGGDERAHAAQRLHLRDGIVDRQRAQPRTVQLTR